MVMRHLHILSPRRLRLPIVAALLVGLLLAAPAVVVHAATLCVNFGGTGGCFSAIGAAVGNASDGDTITVAPAIYYEHDITIVTSITISGSGGATLDAGGLGRGFIIQQGAAVTISGLTVRGGNVGGNSSGGGIDNTNGDVSLVNCLIQYNSNVGINGAGGIANGGTLALSGTTVSDNTTTSSGGAGGGIVNIRGSTLTVTNSTIQYNTAPQGGGIGNNGTVMVTNSTLVGNRADSSIGGGGGIYNNGSSTVTVTNSTFSNNSARFGGGGILSGGTLMMTNSTLVGNYADGANGKGGGIYSGGTLTMTNSTLVGNSASTGGGIYGTAPLTAINTLIAGNTAAGTGPDVGGTFAAGSKNNLLGIDSGSSGITDNDANHNIVGHPAMVDPTLRNNGTTNGTRTLALLPGSPAIDHGDDATCTNTTGIAPVAGKDQRGIARPQPAGGHCDIGAYELIPTRPAPPPRPGPVLGPPPPAPIPPSRSAGAPVSGGPPAPIPMPRR